MMLIDTDVLGDSGVIEGNCGSEIFGFGAGLKVDEKVDFWIPVLLPLLSGVAVGGRHGW